LGKFRRVLAIEAFPDIESSVMKRFPFLLAACLLVRSLYAQSDAGTSPSPVLPPPVVPQSARAGDALMVLLPRPSEDAAFSGQTVLRAPDGRAVKRAAAFPLPSGKPSPSDACVLGIPMTAAPGTYAIELAGTRGGSPWSASVAVAILGRDFLAEDIPLTAALTSIHADPSPRKDEEARTYAEIISRVDPAGVWQDGPFLPPVASERRTSHFGDKRRYLYATGGTATSLHAGIDFAAPTGTPVTACARGRVVLAQDRLSSGKTIVLEHLPGVYTIYMHMNSLSVAPGAVVERGAPLGTVGATGLATGPHLHWELRVGGEACDPESPGLAEPFRKM
jgi:murein DD-endopeptidase MepM/ murein hydrolase activator NlpD